jgi:two-component sensor histidine kinase
VSIVWREQGGPDTLRPETYGFGLRLIEQETAYGLNGRAALEFDRAGLVVALTFPKQDLSNAD